MKYLIFIVLYAVVLWPAALSHAKEFKLFDREFDLRVTSTLRYDYRADNGNNVEIDDKYHYLFNTFDILLTSGNFRFGTRLDLHQFIDSPLDGCESFSTVPAACGHRYRNQYYFVRNDLELPDGNESYRAIWPERIYLSYSDKHWDVTAGDFTITLGTGIALMAIKVSEIGQDNAIRGGKIRYTHGEFEGLVFGGQFNFLDTDAFTGVASKTIWAEESMVGGQLQYGFGDGQFVVGLHGVHVWREKDKSKDDRPFDSVIGAVAKLPRLLDGDMSLLAEVDIQTSYNGSCYNRGFGEDCDNLFESNLHDFKGLASYFRGSLSRGDFTFTAEAKYFNDFRMLGPQNSAEAYRLTYAQAPTLERVYAIPSETYSTGGSRLRTDYNFGELFDGAIELLVFANMTWMRSWGDEGLLEVFDPYGGFELQWNEGKGHWNLMSGYRYERNHEKGQTFRTDIHLFGDFEQLLASKHSLSLNYFFRRSQKRVFTGLNSFTQMDLSLGYKWSPHLALAFYMGYSSEAAAIGGANLNDGFFAGKWMPGGEARYFFDPGNYLRVYAGWRRGGLICVNGICRVVPQFKGVIAEAVARF